MMKIDTARIEVLAPRERLNFFDMQSHEMPRTLTPTEAYEGLTGRMQRRLGWAFALRDALSAPFGVRRSQGVSDRAGRPVSEGERLDFFLVERATPDRLVLTVRDRHLDVMTCLQCEGPLVTVTSSVVTHNAFGRVYMAVVGPAHRVIVRRGLRALARDLAGDLRPSS